MATIKSFTDLPQSKILSTILPPESADMKILPFTEREYRIVPINDISVCGREDEIYAWSLAALLDVLPEPSLIQNQEGSWMLRIWDKKRFPYSVGEYDNPIDACYEMILKLHKFKKL